MSLLNGGNKKGDKKGNKAAKGNAIDFKNTAKATGKTPAFSKKPIKTGGTRGS